MEDLTGMMIDCFELLATMSKSYTPTGNSSHDNSVNRITALMEQWQASEIEVLRTNAELDRRKPSQAPPPPPPSSIVFEDPDANKQSMIDEKLAALDVNASSGKGKETPSATKPVAAATRTAATRNSKNDDYFIKLKEV